MKKVGIVLVALFAAAFLFASPPGKGTYSTRPGGKVSSLEVSYNLSSLMGEAVINGIWKWDGTADSLPSDTVVWLKVTNSMGSAFIKIDSTVPKKGAWSYNTSGSPAWNKVLYQGYNGNQGQRPVDADTAKAFWKQGFQVTGATLSVSVN